MEVHVCLSIVSEHRTPEQITELIGEQPDSAWRVGDLRKHTIIREKVNGWVLESELPKEGADLEVHLEHLLGRVRPLADKIKALAEDADVTVMCSIYTNDNLVVALDPWILREIARLGAGLGVDVYYLPPDDPPPSAV